MRRQKGVRLIDGSVHNGKKKQGAEDLVARHNASSRLCKHRSKERLDNDTNRGRRQTQCCGPWAYPAALCCRDIGAAPPPYGPLCDGRPSALLLLPPALLPPTPAWLLGLFCSQPPYSGGSSSTTSSSSVSLEGCGKAPPSVCCTTRRCARASLLACSAAACALLGDLAPDCHTALDEEVYEISPVVRSCSSTAPRDENGFWLDCEFIERLPGRGG